MENTDASGIGFASHTVVGNIDIENTRGEIITAVQRYIVGASGIIRERSIANRGVTGAAGCWESALLPTAVLRLPSVFTPSAFMPFAVLPLPVVLFWERLITDGRVEIVSVDVALERFNAIGRVAASGLRVVKERINPPLAVLLSPSVLPKSALRPLAVSGSGSQRCC